MIEYTVQVPLPILSTFRTKLRVLKRRCQHVGTPDPIVTEGPITSMELGKYGNPAAQLHGFERPRVRVQVQEFTIQVEPPNLPGGWKVLGVVEIADDLRGNLVHATEIQTETGEWAPHPWMETYRQNDLHCEHCGTKRRRQKIVVLESSKGCLVQVGSTCLSKYIAGVSVAYASSLCDVYCWYERLVKALSADFDPNWLECAGTHAVGYDTLDMLSATAEVIHEYGWLSVGKAGFDQVPTRDRVSEFLHLWARGKESIHQNSRDEAQEALQWIRSKDPEDLVGYMGNLSLVLAEDVVLPKRFGLAVSVFAALQQEKARAAKLAEQERRQKEAPSEWIGEAKQRLEMELTLDLLVDIDGQWGLTELHKFRDSDGNIVIWFSSGRSKFEQGGTYKVKATVKRHDVRDGVKQTIVNRVVEA